MTTVEAFRSNLRMFREFCQNSMRLSGASPQGLRGVTDLQALEAVYAGERPFQGELLKPLSAFCNLLTGGQLPETFTPLNFADACSALGEVLESKGTTRWRFDSDISKRTATRLGLDRGGAGLDRLYQENRDGWERHARQNVRFILDAMQRVHQAGTAVIVGAARAYDLPLDEIAGSFERVIVVDVCEEADVRKGSMRAIRDPAASGRVSIERRDLTGTYNQFVADVGAIVSRAKNESEAERALDDLVSGYDVPESAVHLCRAEIEPDVTISSMVLTQLGLPFKAFVARTFRERGFSEQRVHQGMLGQSLSGLACRVEQHHVAALLRIPKLAVLTSDVNESAVTISPLGELIHLGEPRAELSVESLRDRIPSHVKPLAECAWDWLRVMPKRPGAAGALMHVEGVVLERGN